MNEKPKFKLRWEIKRDARAMCESMIITVSEPFGFLGTNEFDILIGSAIPHRIRADGWDAALLYAEGLLFGKAKRIVELFEGK